MQVMVDPTLRHVSLLDPADTKRFDVLVLADGPSTQALTLVDELLREAALGRIDRSGETEIQAVVDPGALKIMAEPLVDAAWDQEFQAMLDYAATKGWIDPGDGGIRAHLTWRDTS